MRKYSSVFAGLLFLAASLVGGASAFAQHQPPQQQQEPQGQPAGGNWFVFESEDTMTGAKFVQFQLESDNTMPDSDRRSRIVFNCKPGTYKKYENAQFQPSIKMAGPNRPGFWGQPQMEVRVRADGWHDDKGWNWMGRSLSMDQGSIRRLIGAQMFRVEFLAARKKASPAPYIAEFSPAGLDLNRVKAACDITPKH